MIKSSKDFFYVNCKQSQYLVYLSGQRCLGIISKDKQTNKWRISPQKAIGTSKPKYKNRKTASIALKKANNEFYKFMKQNPITEEA